MKRTRRIVPTLGKGHKKAVKYNADRQLNWNALVPELKRYDLESVGTLGITGDAPKDFVIDQEYRPGHRSKSRPKDRFIAKVGSKYYPLESVIEQLLTRVGECFGMRIAKSKLRTVDGQVRFLSKYFLKPGEQLTHGAEIYELSLGKDNYKELADAKEEKHFFTFEMTCGAIRAAFPDEHEQIIEGYVEMLTFDAVVGHNDRHPYNWGVIVPLRKDRKARFSPVFDTARALFWNIPEHRVKQMLNDPIPFEKYIRDCKPSICWVNKQVDFFELIGLIWKDRPQCREHIEKYLSEETVSVVDKVLIDEFGKLISEERRELISRCLHQRQAKVREAVERTAKS